METKNESTVTKRGTITPANARARLAQRNKLAAEGKIKLGRPKGVLNKSTIAAIQSRETFIEHVSKYAGKITDDLLRNSEAGDTRASLGLIDRVGIIATQKIEHEHKFSLVGLQNDRTQLNAGPQTIDGNPAMRIIEAGPDIEEDE